MNKREKYSVDKYLSMKRIVMIALAVTIGFHLLLIVNHFFGRPVMVNPENTEEIIKKPDYLLVALYNVPITFIMVFSVSMYCRKVMGYRFKWNRDEVMAVVVGSLLVMLVLSTLSTYMQYLIWPNPPGPKRTLFGYISRSWFGDLPLVVIVILSVYLLRFQYSERMTAIENEKLRAENLSSRYEALKNQLDPHFLFNSLNTLKSLIDVDVDKAEDFVQQLSVVLRSTLKNEEVVTLATELECVRSYCLMMKIRYGDNLLFDHHIDHEKYDNYSVLPLSIQGLMENAIKHNVISSKQPLTIHVMTDDDNHLIISNKIQEQFGKEEGSGIGLANLSERYRIKWNENVEIFNDGKIFSVTLPLKSNI